MAVTAPIPSWRPSDVEDLDDQVDVTPASSRHPDIVDIVALLEICAHAYALAGCRPYLQLQIDEQPALIAWALEHAERVDHGGALPVTLFKATVGAVDLLLTCATSRFP